MCLVWSAKGHRWRGGSVPADRARGESQLWVVNSLSTSSIQLIQRQLLFPLLRLMHKRQTVPRKTQDWFFLHWVFSVLDITVSFPSTTCKPGKVSSSSFLFYHFCKINWSHVPSNWLCRAQLSRLFDKCKRKLLLFICIWAYGRGNQSADQSVGMKF